jgi:hypothetical protein
MAAIAPPMMKPFHPAELTGVVQPGMINLSDMAALFAAGLLPEELHTYWRNKGKHTVGSALCRFRVISPVTVCVCFVGCHQQPG